MTALREGDLEISLPSGAHGRKFDDASHGLSHCMKAVDFIIELNDRIVFVEIKDPDSPSAAAADRIDFRRRFESGEIDLDLVRKYRDSFLYEWAADRIGKPVHYFVLIALSSLDPAMLLTRSDALKRHLPVDGPPDGSWSRRIVERSVVFNMETWNRHLGHLPVSRLGK